MRLAHRVLAGLVRQPLVHLCAAYELVSGFGGFGIAGKPAKALCRALILADTLNG